MRVAIGVAIQHIAAAFLTNGAVIIGILYIFMIIR